MELSKAPRLALMAGWGLGCIGTSVLGGGAAGGRGGGGGAGGIDDAPVELRREDVWVCPGGPAAERCGCVARLGQSCTSHVIPWKQVQCEEQNRWKMPKVIKSLYLQVGCVTWDTSKRSLKCLSMQGCKTWLKRDLALKETEQLTELPRLNFYCLSPVKLFAL